MKRYPMPQEFDGRKFAQRYSLDTLRDFWADENFLYILKDLPDDPPIFEGPDAPKPSIKTRLDGVTSLPELIALLKEVL